MRVALILPLAVVVLAVIACSVQQGVAFSVSMKSGIEKPRKRGFSRMRIPSVNLGRLEKILRAKGSPMKSKLNSMDRWLKKYEKRLKQNLSRLGGDKKRSGIVP